MTLLLRTFFGAVQTVVDSVWQTPRVRTSKTGAQWTKCESDAIPEGSLFCACHVGPQWSQYCALIESGQRADDAFPFHERSDGVVRHRLLGWWLRLLQMIANSISSPNPLPDADSLPPRKVHSPQATRSHVLDAGAK
jgi:hypothetical protein